MDVTANLLQNGEDTKPPAEVHSVIVKSSDGKLHDFTYNTQTKKLNFALVDDKSRQLTLNINEILSVRSTKIKLSSGLVNSNVPEDEPNKDIPNVLYIYYGYKQNVFIWRVRKAALYFSTTNEKKNWESLLKSAVNEVTGRPKKLLIFINPYGGKRQAKQIYEKQVEPIFKLTGLNCQVILTERANHAYDIIQELADESWKAIDGIISVGGDGLFNEIMCSAIVRTQNEAKIDITDLNVDNLTSPHARFGIIPAGSANSIASSIHGVDDQVTAAIQIAIGSKTPVDCCTIHEKNSLVRISANACSYGWLGQVMEDSEKFRCLGPIRYQFSALRTTIKHPTYFGRVSFALNAPEQDKDLKIPECTKPCSICDGEEKPDPLMPHHWQTDFTHCIACVIPCVSPFTKWGLAPYAGVGDGTLDLALVGKVSRCENLKIMRTVSLYGGKELVPEQNASLKLFRVNRFSFAPAAALGITRESDPEGDKQGSWNVDGELIPQKAETLKFRLRAQLINYFGREVDLEDPRYVKCFCCYSVKKFSKIIVLG